jgi:fucose 4-O-acetylase-like acetyltransferase
VAWLRDGRARALAVPVLLAGVLAAVLVDTRLGSAWTYWRDGYADLGVSPLEGMLTRLVLLGVCLALATAAVALVPHRDGWFARMGSASLVVYLLHGFFVKAAEYAGLPGWAADHPVLALPVVTVGAVLLALALASRPLVHSVTPVVDPVETVVKVR